MQLKEADSECLFLRDTHTMSFPFPALGDPACFFVSGFLPQLHEIQTIDVSCNLIVNACEGTYDGRLIL